MVIQTVDRLRLLVYWMKIDLILAIETSSTICGVAVIEKEHTLSVVEKSADRKHAEILPEFIETALEKKCWVPAQAGTQASATLAVPRSQRVRLNVLQRIRQAHLLAQVHPKP